MSGWSESEVRALVAHVQLHAPVYDQSDQAYRDHATRANIWRSIGQKLGKSGEQCKRKWTYVRDVYVKKRKEEERGWRSKRSRWWLAEDMAFLDPFNQPKSGECGESDCEDLEDALESGLEGLAPEVRLEESRHPVEEYFQAMARTVLLLPPSLQARVKRDVAAVVTQAECSLYEDTRPAPSTSD